MGRRQTYRHRILVRNPGLVREEIRNGTKFLVVPVVMLQEQVLFCGNCHPDGEFIAAEEIQASAPTWDNRPVTLSHPTEPWTPTNHRQLEVGRVFNVRWESGKLKGEMWLDIQALRKTMQGREAETRFRDGEVTEISTGYFVERVNRGGSFNGTKFALRQVGIVPDHLAILIGETGACSVEGGCGAPRLNASGEGPMDDTKKLLARIANFLMGRSDDDEGEGTTITEGDGTGDGEGAGSEGSGAGTAENDDGGGALASATGDDGDSGEGTSDEGSATSMNEKERKALVGRILKSGKVETFDEKALLAMTDEQLSSLATLAGCACSDGDGGPSGGAAGEGTGDAGATGADGGDVGAAGGTGGEGDGEEEEAVALSRDDAQFVSQLRQLSGGTVEGLSSLIEAGKQEAERRETVKKELVARLNKDDRVAMPEHVLKSMTLEALEGFDRSLNPLSYAGRGGPRIDNTGNDDGFAPDAPGVVLNVEADEGGDA